MDGIPNLVDLRSFPNRTPTCHPVENAQVIPNWGWIDPRISLEEFKQTLVRYSQKQSMGFAAAIHLSVLQNRLPGEEVIFYALQSLGAAARKSRNSLTRVRESAESLLKQWPPPAPPYPIPIDPMVDGQVYTLLQNALTDTGQQDFDDSETDGYYYSPTVAGALPDPMRHPGVRESFVTLAYQAGLWNPRGDRKILEKSVLLRRAKLEELRMCEPFQYKIERGLIGLSSCKHPWFCLDGSVWRLDDRRWRCLQCFEVFLCSCDVSWYLRAHGGYSAPDFVPLPKLCPHCKGNPDLLPPSPNQLMYHSTMFDVIHSREVWRIERDHALALMDVEEDLAYSEAVQRLLEERGKHWARDAVRETHGFEIHERWVSETALVNAVRKAFPQHRVIREASPNWLTPQRFDAFVPNRKLAFEYHGSQHFWPVEFFGGQKAFRRRAELDKRKRQLCEENGVGLIVFVEGDLLTAEEVKRRAVVSP